MSGLLLVHAHPDDETIWTGGTIARYAAQGVHVTVVTCTLGERGEIIPPELRGAGDGGDGLDGLASRRRRELAAAGAALGVSEQRFLGGPGCWRDSGMVGEPGGRASAPAVLDTRALAAGPVGRQAEQLADVLAELCPRVVVTYGPDGGYGHPDHVRAHEITMAAARQVSTVGRVCWTVHPRSAVRDGLAQLRSAPDLPFPLPRPGALPGVDDREVTTTVDVTPVLTAKMAALRAHRTQVEVWQADGYRALALADGFARPVGTREFYTVAAGPVAGVESDLFGGLSGAGGTQ